MDQERQFIEYALRQAPPQWVENIASEAHESRRISDPYLFIEADGVLKTPNGLPVVDFMETSSYLGRVEFAAFLQIQSWASQAESGYCVWFSPPLPPYYPVSKFIVSSVRILTTGEKVLFNRAIILDVSGPELVRLANQLIPGSYLSNPETLRATPLFPQETHLAQWFEKLRRITPQIDDVVHHRDLEAKIHTYQLIANDQVIGLMGGFIGSCPVMFGTEAATPFEFFFQYSLGGEGKKTLKCTCPFCNHKVNAVIENGKIYCPKCQKSAPYTC